MKTTMNIFPLVMISIMISSCGNKTTQVKDQPKNDSVLIKENPPTQEIQYTSYTGILPCSKCDGITTTLNISSDGQNASIDMSHLDNPFVEEGYDYPLNTERGYENDPDATVYVLNPDQPVNDQRYFVRLTGKDSEVFEIGKNRKKFKDGKNHTLTKNQ
jgi:hypothetical protein